MLLQNFGHGFASERRPTAQELEHYAAEGVQVGAVRQRRLPLNLLGGHVMQRAHRLARSRQTRLGGDQRQTKGAELYLSRPREPEVPWFQIAVDDAAGVGIVQCRAT